MADAAAPVAAYETETEVMFIAGDADPHCQQKFACFSNYYPCRIELDGFVWGSTEHWFQAQKYTADPAYQEKIRCAASPAEACELGRTRSVPLRADWEQVKLGLMQRVQRAKYSQNADLRAQLLATGNKTITQYHPRDKFWGNGGDGSGANMMGKILMEVRDELRTAQ